MLQHFIIVGANRKRIKIPLVRLLHNYITARALPYEARWKSVLSKSRLMYFAVAKIDSFRVTLNQEMSFNNFPMTQNKTPMIPSYQI